MCSGGFLFPFGRVRKFSPIAVVHLQVQIRPPPHWGKDFEEVLGLIVLFTVASCFWVGGAFREVLAGLFWSQASVG